MTSRPIVSSFQRQRENTTKPNLLSRVCLEHSALVFAPAFRLASDCVWRYRVPDIFLPRGDLHVLVACFQKASKDLFAMQNAALIPRRRR